METDEERAHFRARNQHSALSIQKPWKSSSKISENITTPCWTILSKKYRTPFIGFTR